jgi:hypothetical protein
MHRLPFLLVALALLGTAGSGILFLRNAGTRQVLAERLADAERRAAKLEGDLGAAHEQVGGLKVRLADAESQGAQALRAAELARESAEAATRRATEAEQELGRTRDALGLYESTASSLAAEVAGLQRELTAVHASSIAPETAAAYREAIADLERQLAVARNGATVSGSAGGSTAVFANRAGRGTVLSVGPESAFVVINFGEARGAQLGHRMTVGRGPAVLATVELSDVRENFSVGQVQPESLRGVLQKGDSAVLIR